VIQDLTTKMLIGSDEHRKGVYFYNEGPTIQLQANKVDSHDLWHRRMGHPSTKHYQTYLVFLGINNRSSSKDICDVCLMAKQTRLPFSVSEHKALMNFVLVHCDIWGAYVKSFCGASYFLTILDDASRCEWVYLMKERSKASKIVQNFCANV